MCEAGMCRICLRNDSKFYNYDEFNLKKYYEEVTNKSVNKKDGLPQYFCYECAALLHKFHLFREKCYLGEKVLKNMLYNGPLTYANSTHELKGKILHKLKFMNLDILISNKRVKTYHFRHIEDEDDERPQTPKLEIISEDFTEGPFSDDDNFACNDPETDPVDLDLTFDFDVKAEQALNIIENKNEPVETGKKSEIEEEIKPEKKIVKPKQIKKRPIPKSKKKQKSRKTKPIESDTESDDIELSKIKLKKNASVVSPVTKKTYKFCRPKGGGQNFDFLNSDKWKRSIFSDEDAKAEFLKKALHKKYLNAPYKCDLCYKGFSQKNMLDRHMPQRHAESVGPIECRFCKMRFKSNYFVNKHLKQHYNKYECLRCGLVCCLESTALLHEEYHSGVKRKCPHCDKEFQHLSTFYTHLRTHRSKHMCALCGESFVSQLGLHLHRKAKHQADTKNTVVDTDGAIYCEICKINFESKTAYQNHLAHSALHAEENKKSDEFMANEMLKAEEKREGQEDADTHVKGLVNRKSMVEKELCAVRKSGKGREIRLHIKRPTSCQHCGAKFQSLSAGLKHHLAEHRGKPFTSERVICEICGASLAVGSVAAHLNKHTRSKMYTCDTCGRSFTTSNILKNHLVTHTGERNHPCSLCDKSFTQNGSLNLHYRTFHLKQPYPKRNRRKRIEKVEEDCLI